MRVILIPQTREKDLTYEAWITRENPTRGLRGKWLAPQKIVEALNRSNHGLLGYHG